jgi:hypothetical protein
MVERLLDASSTHIESPKKPFDAPCNLRFGALFRNQFSQNSKVNIQRNFLVGHECRADYRRLQESELGSQREPVPQLCAKREFEKVGDGYAVIQAQPLRRFGFRRRRFRAGGRGSTFAGHKLIGPACSWFSRGQLWS